MFKNIQGETILCGDILKFTQGQKTSRMRLYSEKYIVINEKYYEQQFG